MIDGVQGLGAAIHLEADSIFAGTLLRVTVRAQQPFAVRVHPEPIELVSGCQDRSTGKCVPMQRDGVHLLEYVTTGAFVETQLAPCTEEGPAFRYGMRFFPFFSSTCTATFEFDAPIVRAVLLDIPEEYRTIWYRSLVEGNGESAQQQHSLGNLRSTFIFEFERLQASCRCAILLRLGGQRLTELVRYPLSYWLVALVGLAVLYDASFRIVLGAVSVLWAFMLRQWRQAKAPQRSTLLTRAYVGAGILSLLWATFWKSVGLWASVALPVVFGAAWWGLRVTRFFEENGQLPRRLARHWQRVIQAADRKQRRTHTDKL